MTALRNMPSLLLDEPSPCHGFEIEWRNAWDSRGHCESWAQAFDLIEKVGSCEPWAFLVFATPSRRFAQCCGSGSSGLAVEVGDGRADPRLVVPRGSEALPESLTVCGRWSYWACPLELHATLSAAAIVRSWLTTTSIAPNFEFRSVHVGGGWGVGPVRASFRSAFRD